MLPTASDVHVDALNTDIAVRFKNRIYIADQVFPGLRVQKQSGKYAIFKKGSWFRNEAGPRPPGARSRRGGYKVTTGTYHCEEQAFSHPVPDEVRANYELPGDADARATEFVTDKLLLKKENDVGLLVRTAGNWTTSEDAEGGWVASSGNTFVADVIKGIKTIKGLTGVKPNRLLIDDKTFLGLQTVSDIVDRIKYTGTGDSPATVTERTLAALFQLDAVLVGSAIYSDAEEVVAGTDFNAVDVWETNAGCGLGFLYYAQPLPSIDMPSAGYILNWPADEIAGLNIAQEYVARGVRRWREAAEHQDVIEAFENYQAKAVAADLGYLFYDTYAT